MKKKAMEKSAKHIKLIKVFNGTHSQIMTLTRLLEKPNVSETIQYLMDFYEKISKRLDSLLKMAETEESIKSKVIKRMFE